VVSLVAEGLSVAIRGRRVLHDVTLTLDRGLVGVLGPNGAGKSTLVRALLGLVPATGLVAIDGVEARARADIARRIAYLPQGQQLHWPVSVERLVALGRLPHLAPFSRLSDTDRAAIDRAMAAADVADLAERPATELSGGERARALLARALAVEAPALIADEPLASLDPAHQLAGMALLRAQADAGLLVVAVLHDLALAARHCDRVLVLDRGAIVADGAPYEALTPALLASTFGIRAAVAEVEGARALVTLGPS
jgi:iron complex transport system ATP-binding protein